MAKVQPRLDYWLILKSAVKFFTGFPYDESVEEFEYTNNLVEFVSSPEGLREIVLPKLSYRAVKTSDGWLLKPLDSVTDDDLQVHRDFPWSKARACPGRPYPYMFMPFWGTNLSNPSDEIDWSFLFQREGFLLPFDLEVKESDVIREITDDMIDDI